MVAMAIMTTNEAVIHTNTRTHMNTSQTIESDHHNSKLHSIWYTHMSVILLEEELYRMQQRVMALYQHIYRLLYFLQSVLDFLYVRASVCVY